MINNAIIIVMDTVKIFDTTLRDGEQSPGASMSLNQKMEIAEQLEVLGVDIIEAGFPVSSPEQLAGVKAISKARKQVTIAALARAVDTDIDIAAEAIETATHPRIHTFIATSPLHMEHKLKMAPEQVMKRAVTAVKRARNLCAEVEFSAEDATRSDPEFMARIFEKVIDAGATIINIPDTVGYTTPTEMYNLFMRIKELTPNIDKAILSTHCHDDLGLAVANSLSAVRAGARQAEVTINGIGERAGNASLEELVMAIRVRSDQWKVKTDIHTEEIYRTSKLVSHTIGFHIARNKAIVGENAFSHEAGIHQHGMIAHSGTYEIMTPQSVGRERSRIVLGRHSGLHGVQKRIGELGVRLDKGEMDSLYARFLEIADKKREVYDEDLLAIIDESTAQQSIKYNLDFMQVLTGNTLVPTATVRIQVHDEIKQAAATGDGPVDAIFRAIDSALETSPSLIEYSVHALTPGKQALGEVHVTLRNDKREACGYGSSTDTIEASAKAYLHAQYLLYFDEQA